MGRRARLRFAHRPWPAANREADRALAIKEDFIEAITYKNLLLRQQALVEKDPKKQKELIDQADKLRNRAIELQKLKTKGVGA